MSDHIDTAPDVDPDEALAKALWEIDDPEPTYGWDRARANGVYLRMARAAREYIEAEFHECYAREDATAHERAEKAEADLARVTEEMESERAPVREAGPEETIGSLIAKADRYEALRDDVERQRDDLPWDSTRLIFSGILDRDDERGRDE